MSSQEFVGYLRYCLGVPLFSATSPVRCPCGSVVDQFGNHLLGCGHGPMRIRSHDVLCDVIYHALLQDNTGCLKEQGVLAPDWIVGRGVRNKLKSWTPITEILLEIRDPK